MNDLKNIEALLAEKKYDEVRAILQDVAEEKMSSAEKGEAYTDLVSMYLDISNRINSEYLDALNEAVAGMEALNKGQSRFNDKVRIAEVKASLGR